MPSPLLRLSVWSLKSSLVILVLGPLVSAQGENGYLRGSGGWLVGFSYQEAEFKETIGQGQGSVLDVDRKSMSLYLNFGLRDDLDVIIQPLYQKAEFSQFPIVPAEENLTDIQVYAKWRLWKREIGPGELHFLAAPGLQTDLKNYETDGFLSLGAGQTDWRARGIAHYQARTGSWFAAVETGYDFRTGAPPDNLVIRSQLGINLGPVLLQPYYDIFDARGGGDEGGVVSGSPQAGGLDYDVWGIKAFVPIGSHAGIYGGYFELDDDRPSGVIPGFGFGLVVSG
ncbi:MAG: hypothetical protein ACI8QS_000694 [Planctomycetota bacterium]|jgi:hypothetical protein